MEKKEKELLEEARQLELKMADLYFFYHEKFMEDKDFWLQMAKEEVEHAALLEVAGDFFDKFPKELILDNLDTIKSANKKIKDTIEKYKIKLPAREEVYKFAIDMENSAYELHYQKLATEQSSEEKVGTFQKLNASDKDHAIRIQDLLASKKEN